MSTLATIDFKLLGEEVMEIICRDCSDDCSKLFVQILEKHQVNKDNASDVMDILVGLGYPVRFPGVVVNDREFGLMSVYWDDFQCDHSIRTVSPPNKKISEIWTFLPLILMSSPKISSILQ